MPRLRSQSINFVSTRNAQSSCKKTISSSNVDSVTETQSKPIRSILKQSNAGANTRITRSSSANQRATSSKGEPIKTKKTAQSHKPIFSGETKSIEPVVHSESKTVPKRRKRKTDPPKPAKPVDPYDFDLFATSEDEKENIDPKESTRGMKQPTSTIPKTNQSNQEKTRKAKSNSNKKVVPTPASPTAPLSGRPSVHFGNFKHFTVPVSPRRLPTESALAELERRKSASTTILLSLPPSRLTLHNSSVFSANSLTPHLLSASTPANQTDQTGVHVVNKSIKPGPSVLLSPLSITAPVTPAITSKPSQSFGPPETHPEVLAHSPTTSPSLSHSEEQKETSHSSHDHSGDSKSSSGRRRRRHMSDGEREEAYDSWLEEFNAQLEKFESHELTVVEDQSSQ